MRFFLIALIFAVTLPATAQTVPPLSLAANAWLLADHQTGEILTTHNPDERIEPASLTKLMTAYVTFSALKAGNISLDQQVQVSEKAWRMTGSRMFIEPRKPVSVEELIHGMIIQSGNDACVALAEHIAGSEEAFVHLMNREAQRLGMRNTQFTNTSGLPDDSLYTTARDLAVLASALIRDFPEFYPLYSKKEYTYNNITQPNRNRLLYQDPSVDGMKTGYTRAAGYCLVSTAQRGPRRLISIVLGAESEAIRAQESLKLLNYGFQFFETVRLYEAGQSISRVEVWKGVANDVAVGFVDEFVMSVPKDGAQRLEVSLLSNQPVMAPVQRGQVLGTLNLSMDGKLLGEFPVVALEEVEEAGYSGRLWDSIRLWLKER